MFGKDILKIASSHVGEAYVLGARAILSNPHHKGPWDCAEYASWCAYQTYRIVFGTYGSNPKSADPYSGKWYEDAKAANTLISVAEALATPGAFVVRKPNDFNAKIGHVAICVGDGRLYEARSASKGVMLSDDAYERNWTAGVQLPGVLYTAGSINAYAMPAQVLRVKHPFMRGDAVLAVQCALEQRGFSVGTIDGIYGGDTESAVTNFQITAGLTVDGEVGPETARSLELGWPIDTSLAEGLCAGLSERLEVSSDPQGADDGDEDLRGLPEDDLVPEVLGAPVTITIEQNGRAYWATHDTGRFFVGSKVKYGAYWGLYQKISDLPKLGGGRYDPEEASRSIGQWAHVLYPTIMGESHGYFGRLNTYDRARFTFGCFQMAAHTAGDNLILLFREMLKLPDATRYFPDLVLENGRVHKIVNGRTETLETEVYSEKHRETQLPDFMAYLNPSLSDVEEEEALAAARLMLWTAESEAMRHLQVTLARDTIQKKIGYADAKGLNIMDLPVPHAIWCMDLRHQGRAKISEIQAALAKANVYEALKWAGRSEKHKSRVQTVDAGIQALLTHFPDWAARTLADVVD